MTTAMPYLPRIYALQAQLLGSATLDKHLARCTVLGFSHVLIPNLCGMDTSSVGNGAPSDPRWRDVAQACARHDLQLMIDLDIGSVEASSVLAKSHPHWFAKHPAQDDLPDPRRIEKMQRRDRSVFRYEQAELAAEIIAHWQQRLHYWVEAGVRGFRCMELALPAPAVWTTLIASTRAASPSTRFLAWTPGCSPQQIAGLAGCGFDATFSSGAWWDYRAPWLVHELARLATVAPPIAFPDSPEASAIARIAGAEDSHSRRLLYQRALRLAAVSGNGILITMGFEYGFADLPEIARKNIADDWDQAPAGAAFDLSAEVAQANAWIAVHGPEFYAAPLDFLSAAEAKVAILLRRPAAAMDAASDALLIVANADPLHACTLSERQLLERAQGYVRRQRLWPTQHLQEAPALTTSLPVALGAADLQVFSASRLPAMLLPPARGKQAVVAAARAPRIAIEAVSPSVDDGKFPVKRIVGDTVDIEADVFIDGHEKLAVVLLWRAADEANWQEIRMHALGNDRWSASLSLTRLGRYLFAIEAWKDVFATYRDELEKKSAAGLQVGLELEEGRLLVESAAAYAKEHGIESAAVTLKAMASSLKVKKTRSATTPAVSDAERIATLLAEPTADAMREADARPFALRSAPPYQIDAERSAARFSSWYELFPRSQSGDVGRHGTFADVIKRLPAIQAMGFDTLYFPPIHPIGSKHRKGRNNSLTPAADDPGSPYAIGAQDGGHDAIHAELGTLADFHHLRDEAARHGLELALDFAIQCSPDHPWLAAHPEWFDWRPDGSIRYAENPPKKYQDIVNVDFYAEGAPPGLWQALREAVLFWVKQGVRVFRVDNPHTKPLPFWEWMIADIRARYPDTIFLSEAFTRPKMMYRLAKVGFSQSYTYFTWRHSKQEFTEYLTELTTTSVREYFRPHFFVNTPDINPYFLQRSGRPGFLIRAALATTLSGLWGMYSGFELCEATPVPGKEEYLDSEKFEIRAWDWQRPGNIIEEITLLNRIRSENPALQSHLGIRFLQASNDNILYFLKSSTPHEGGKHVGDNVLLVAINLDPHTAHGTTIELPLWELGLADDASLALDDLVNGQRLTWHGKQQQLWLDPLVCPFAIWRIRPQGGA